jgi:protein disulfide-isomerase
MKRIMVLAAKRLLATCAAVTIVLVILAKTSHAETPQQSAASARISDAKVHWYTDLQSGWAAAHQRNLPMVIFITSKQCRYCDAMKRDSWRNHSIEHQIASEFIAIELTPERNQSTLDRIKVPAFPTTLIGTPSGKIVGQRVGYQPPAKLMALLSQADPHRIR